MFLFVFVFVCTRVRATLFGSFQYRPKMLGCDLLNKNVKCFSFPLFVSGVCLQHLLVVCRVVLPMFVLCFSCFSGFSFLEHVCVLPCVFVNVCLLLCVCACTQVYVSVFIYM